MADTENYNPYSYIETTGVVVTDTSKVKEQVQKEYQKALGEDLDLNDSTPQGRLIEAETIARKRTIENMALLANMFNKNQAFGIFLDSLASVFGIDRIGATRTRVTCTLSGEEGTVVPANAQVQDTNGNLYYLENKVEIDEEGTATGVFLAMNKGAIDCQANTVTQIVTAVLGWTSVSNSSAGITGLDGESDNSLRQQFSVKQYSGDGQSKNVENKVLQVDDVIDCLVLENETNASKTVEGIVIATPHSIYVCVDGGEDNAVAQAIYQAKSGGCAYGADGTNTPTASNLITKSVNNTTVIFARPSTKEIEVKVTLASGQATNDMKAKVKQAITQYVGGNIEQVEGLRIGTFVSPFEIASAITIQIPEIYISQVEIKVKNVGSFSTATISVNANEKATIDEEDITVL